MKKVIVIKLLFISFLFLVISSCKKYSKELTTINFHVYNPVSGGGLSGVHVSIVEQEDVTKAFQVESKYETKVIWEGVTDSDGKASYSFNAMKKDKFTYWQNADVNYIQANNRKLLKQPDFQEKSKNVVNNNEYTFTVPASFVGHYKNVNCLNSNDRFRFRFSKKYNSTSFGCYELTYNYNGAYEDYLIYEYEVERNGILNTYLDTFYINPNFVDTLKIYY